MSTEALRTLEQLRENAVDEAKRALALAQQGLARAEDLRAEATARLSIASRKLADARQANQELRAARDYHWAERTQQALRLAEVAAEGRLEKAQAIVLEARAAVSRAEDVWREAELGRRATSHVVRERAAQRAHKAELLAEEEAADIHRARRP